MCRDHVELMNRKPRSDMLPGLHQRDAGGGGSAAGWTRVGVAVALVFGVWGAPPLASAQTGPQVVYFGTANSDGCVGCEQPLCNCGGAPTPTPQFDDQGRQIFMEPSGVFRLVVEARPGSSGQPVCRGAVRGTQCTGLAALDTTTQPDLQIENTQTMGVPTPGVVYCQPTPIPRDLWGGIGGVSPPSFGSGQDITEALQNFACRFSFHDPTDPYSVCTLNTYGNAAPASTDATAQYCDPIDSLSPFPPGDSLLSVRLRDVAGNLGPTAQIVVRVAGATYTPTPPPMASPTPTPSAPAGTLQLSGHVQYYSNALPVSAVAVHLDGPLTTATQTDVNGQYAFTGLPSASWTVTPQKTGDVGSAITALDAVYVLQSAVGLRTLSTAQQLAGDVNGDGQVTALDAVLILQYNVGLISGFPVAQTCGSDWAFVPMPVAVANQVLVQPQISPGTCQAGAISLQPLATSASNQDFAAVLFGDLTGDWQPPAGGGGAAP